MKKLKLNLDQITVNSFDADGSEGGKGTVRAHTYTYQSGVECETGRQDSCYSCPAPPYCDAAPITSFC
ncbi:MAG TPA: hypothetical protein VFS20_33065 [Longimicrobium sp.]|nr:hypothetical protein [Longimicrobium sp.]